MIERLSGRLVLLSTLVLGVVVGDAAWMVASALGLANVPDYTIGSSAGVCALLGMMLAYSHRHRAHLSRPRARAMRAQAGLGIALMLLTGLVVPNINNVAHVAGLFGGGLLAYMRPRAGSERRQEVRGRLRVVLTSVLMLALLSIFFAGVNLASRLTA
jgi:rhomboid protease GluP